MKPRVIRIAVRGKRRWRRLRHVSRIDNLWLERTGLTGTLRNLEYNQTDESNPKIITG